MEVGPLNSMIVIFQGNCCVTRGCFCLNFVELEANSAFLDPLLHLCRVSSISKHHLKSTKKCCSCDRTTRPCNVAYQMVSALRHCFFHCILALKFAWLCPFQGLFWLGSEWRVDPKIKCPKSNGLSSCSSFLNKLTFHRSSFAAPEADTKDTAVGPQSL